MITPIDTLTAQQKAFESCSSNHYETLVMTPLECYWQPLMQYFPEQSNPDSTAMQAARMMGFYLPEEGCPEGIKALKTFADADTWNACVHAATKALSTLNPAAHGINLEPILFTLALGSLRTLDLKYGAYTGAQQAGAVIIIGYPNPVGTPRLPVASAHEINHIVRFAYEPFMPDLTLGKYLVAEGLAEAFGLEITGNKNLVGPYSTALSQEQIKQLKPRFKEALTESDFGIVRGYIFGDWAAEKFHYPKMNIPDFAGYTLGFELVNAYLKRTNTTATKATYVPWQEIIEASSYFE